MSQTKLKILQNYIRDNFASDRIRHFVANINVSILFIFKKNNEFRLCVDYKDLNAITQKNKVFLFFIDETLNRLINTRYFIKLDFKNVYYKIKIKKKTSEKLRFVYVMNFSSMQ